MFSLDWQIAHSILSNFVGARAFTLVVVFYISCMSYYKYHK